MIFNNLTEILISARRFVKGFLHPLAFFQIALKKKYQYYNFESVKKQFITDLVKIKSSGETKLINLTWADFNKKVEERFKPEPPFDFLKDPVIMMTMFATAGGSWMKTQLNYLETRFNKNELKALLEEDFVGAPLLLNGKYKTSHSSIQHLYSLTRYLDKTGKKAKDLGPIIEWGGGYGNFAKILLRLTNKNNTYIIIDSPVFCCIQKIYLSSVFGGCRVNIITDKKDKIKKGKINLLPVNILERMSRFDFKPDLFVSTWALSESPKIAQKFVIKNNFFGAKKILFAGQQSDERFESATEIRKEMEKRCSFSENISFLKGNKYFFN